jgi:hypothetical protein
MKLLDINMLVAVTETSHLQRLLQIDSMEKLPIS